MEEVGAFAGMPGISKTSTADLKKNSSNIDRPFHRIVLNPGNSLCYKGFPTTGGSTVQNVGIGVFVFPSKCARAVFVCALTVALLTGLAPVASAQLTLGGITGTVTDPSGAVVSDATVKAVNIATNLEVVAHTKNGSFVIPDLPAGTYRVTVTKDGFKTETHTEILVFGNRTTTVDTTLVVGSIGTTVEVNAVPLMNQVDTTIGYVVDTQTIETTPLGPG